MRDGREQEAGHTLTVDSAWEAEGSGKQGVGPGTRIRQYELIRRIGQGGMGSVFLARDLKLARRVAIKLIRRVSASSAARFLAEARATAQCQHENIVVIHEVDAFLETPYMVLEYLQGESLEALLVRTRVTPARVLELIVPVVRALEHAHSVQLVHRDLKPANIFVTRSGQIKVLDFGIATTQVGRIAGTAPYMAPEQWGEGTVDARTDIWAVGVVLYELLFGRRPLLFESRVEYEAFARSDTPVAMPIAPDCEISALANVAMRCLHKSKSERFGSARELLRALELLAPTRQFELADHPTPYPGLCPFEEADADRFFGREGDVARVVARIRDRALVGIAGASGAGKSSLLRAGFIPALKASGEPWETLIIRPGRHVLRSLAGGLRSIVPGEQAERFAEQLARAPGTLGALLRTRCVERNRRLLLFVDQLEELYTLGASTEARAAFLRCLTGAADDVASPVRVVVALRSDFLDRVASDRIFMEELAAGLLFLQPPDKTGLRRALCEPAALAGYRFEEESIIDVMVEDLATTEGALPLLQFAASRLWEQRDVAGRLLTRDAYDKMGGVAGTLASHADRVVGGLDGKARPLCREIFVRLVTEEMTRRVVEREELLGLSDSPALLDRTLQVLIRERLLVVRGNDEEEGGTIEVVHESLIDKWPTLQRWLSENKGDVALVAQLQGAAKQWQARGRPPGLVWRGEAAEDLRRWHQRHRGSLSTAEQAYVTAVLSLAVRSNRRKRAAVAATIVTLLAIVIAGSVAFVKIQRAEKTALRQAEMAKVEAANARLAEQRSRERERMRRLAQERADKALETAQQERARAEKAARQARKSEQNNKVLAESERQARQQSDQLLEKERARVRKLERERSKIINDLK